MLEFWIQVSIGVLMVVGVLAFFAALWFFFRNVDFSPHPAESRWHCEEVGRQHVPSCEGTCIICGARLPLDY